MTSNQAIIDGLKNADKDLVDAMELASSVMELIVAMDKGGVEEKSRAFRQKVNSALETYVSACESQAGIAIPHRIEKGGVGEDT